MWAFGQENRCQSVQRVSKGFTTLWIQAEFRASEEKKLKHYKCSYIINNKDKYTIKSQVINENKLKKYLEYPPVSMSTP